MKTILSRSRLPSARWLLAPMLAALALLAGSAAAQPTQRIEATDREVAAFFDRYMARKMNELQAPGGAMVVVRNGRVIFARGYGIADLASGRRVHVSRSLFRAASASKILPWLLTMQLVEEGRIDLDRDVNAYLDFTIPPAFGHPVTMRHLLTHTAGFPEHFHGLFDADQSVPLGRRLRDNIPERVYAPGTTVAYSNYGAALAGYIVERLRGAPWEQIVQERVFGPLRMRRSTVSQPPPPQLLPDLVSNYHHGSERPEEYRTSLAPMGALTASPADMGRLLVMLATGGGAGNSRIVDERTLDRMLTLQQPLAPGLPDGMGFGFLVGSYRGVPYAGHAGNMTSLATDLEILPDHGLAWYYVFNSQGPGERARQVRDDLLRRAITRFIAPGTPAVPASVGSSADDVAGFYLSSRRVHSGPLMFSGLLNTTDVQAESDGSLRITSGGATTRWRPAGRDWFVEAESGVPLRAVRDEQGRVVRIASAGLYPVAVFDRAPLLSRIVPYWAAAAFGTLILSLLLKPVIWVFRRLRRRGKATAVEPQRSGSRTWFSRLARISYWLIIATLAAWLAFGIAVAIDFGLLFERPALVRYMLGLMALLTLPFALIIAADALLGWRNADAGLLRRLGSSVTAVGALALALLLVALDVTDVSTRW